MEMVDWLNIELSSRCNKVCSFCDRAKARKEGMETGDIDIELFNHIVSQFKGDIIQFNKDGEPLLYDKMWAIGQICKNYITNIVTNGLLLWEKRNALINNFTSVTVSVTEDDSEQFEIVKKFTEHIGDGSPNILIKFLGDYDNPEYEKLGLRTMRRSIHNPEGDAGYKQSKSPIPELGVCIDFLMKPSIDWRGKFHICNRYDPQGEGIIGDCNKQTLQEIWGSDKRRQWLEYHKQDKRDLIPLCKQCQYWGYPAV